MVWSPDGQRFLGTANGLGQFWNIGVLEAASGEIRAVSETDRYNCTGDWSGSEWLVYARGIIPETGGFAELWEARADGQERRRLYAEAGRHLYGACASPDGKYVLFTRSVEDLGKAISTQMAVIRHPRSGGADRGGQAARGPCAGWDPLGQPRGLGTATGLSLGPARAQARS